MPLEDQMNSRYIFLSTAGYKFCVTWIILNAECRSEVRLKLVNGMNSITYLKLSLAISGTQWLSASSFEHK